MIRKRKLLAGVGVAALAASSVTAGTLPPLPGIGVVFGESLLRSSATGFNATDAGAYVDWAVGATTDAGWTAGFLASLGVVPTAGLYLYAYQVEVASTGITGTGTHVTSFTVSTFNATLPANVSGVPGYSTADLDSIHVIPGEHEAGVIQGTYAGGKTSDGVLWNAAIGGGGVVDFTATGNESGTMFFLSPIPPSYGMGNAKDGQPPSPWQTDITGSTSIQGEPVPIPAGVPEPSEYLMAGLGILGLGYFIRRKRLSVA